MKIIKVKNPCRIDNLFRIIIECKRLRIPLRLAVKSKDFDRVPKNLKCLFLQPLNAKKEYEK